MKKTIIWLCIVLWTSYGIINANNMMLELPIVDTNIEASIWDIELEFCNKENTAKHKYNLELSAQPNEKKDICMNLKNKTKKDVLIDLEFVDWAFTNDKEAKKACKNKADREMFGRHVEWWNEKVLVKANSQVILNKSITLDESHIWLNNGCVTYSIADTKPLTEWGMAYRVIIRKASFIDVKVEWEIRPSLHFITQWWWNNLKQSELIIKEHTSYVDIYTTIKNDWNIPMMISGTWKLTDIFGRSRDIGSGEIRLLPKETRELHFSVDKERRWYFNLLWMKDWISWYRTIYHATLSLHSQAITAHQQEAAFKNINTLQATAFLIPWRLFVMIVLIISYIWYKAIYKKKNKKHENLDKNGENRNEKDDTSIISMNSRDNI